MCGPNVTMTIEDTVNHVVDKFVTKDKMFTAFDVTLYLRKEYKDDFKHYEIKQIVHNIYHSDEMPDVYIRTLVDFKDFSSFVYYPNYKDISEYEIENEKIKTDNIAIKSLTDEKRLSIPVKAIKALGLKSRDTFIISYVFDKDYLICRKFDIDKVAIPNIVWSNVLIVDVDNRVRINSKDIKKAFDILHDRYEITWNNDNITIEPV